MSEWWTIEVFDGAIPASAWRSSWEDALIESAVTFGAGNWEWHTHPWGLVLELAFPGERHWETWRALPGTRAALDAVPDPVGGLVVYPGRGGSSASPVPRRPRPAPGAAAIGIEPPAEERVLDVRSGELPGLPEPDAAPGPATVPLAS